MLNMRPCKTTVDYFPHYTAHGKTMFALENAFGNDGYAAWFKILEILGRTPGHCYDMSKSIDKHYLSAYLRLDVAKLDAVLEMLVDVEAIDGELYERGLIWSDNFAKNLSALYDKRKGNPPEKPVIDGRNKVSGTGNKVSGARKPQSKVKESKEDKTKDKYGTFSNVLLTGDELEKLKNKFPDYQERIDRLSEGIESKGYKYRSHYATILSWSRNDKGKSKRDEHDDTRSRWAQELLQSGNDCEGDEGVVGQIQGPQAR